MKADWYALRILSLAFNMVNKILILRGFTISYAWARVFCFHKVIFNY